MELMSWMREIQGTYIETVLLAAGQHRPLADRQVSDEEQYGAKNWLDDRGLIRDENLASEYTLTSEGQRLADALHRSRTSGEGRWDRVTRAIAEVVLAYGDEQSVTVVDGIEVSDSDRELVIDRLKKWGLIEVEEALGYGVVRVDPLPRLAEVFDVHGSLRDHYEGQRGLVDNRTTNTTHISGGNVGVAMTGGSHNTAHVTQVITPADQARIFTKVAEILGALDNVEDSDELRAKVEAIQEAATQPQMTKPGIKQKVIEAMAVAGVTQGVDQAVVLLSQLLSEVMG